MTIPISKDHNFKFSLIHLLKHLLLAFFCGGIGFILSQKTGYFVFGFLIHLFIDFDHLIEYLVWSKGKFDFFIFFTGDYFNQKDKIYLIFHCWEFVLISLLIWCFNKEIILLVFIVSFLVHYFFDLYSYKNNFKVYLLVYRIRNKFEKKLIFTKK